MRSESDDTSIGLHCAGHTVRLPRTIRSKPKDWAIIIRGKQPIYGSVANFEAAVNGFQMAPISPVLGWGRSLFITDPTGKAIEGATVLLDGKVTAESNAQGEVLVLSNTYPKAIRIEHGRTAQQFDGTAVTQLTTLRPSGTMTAL